MNTGLTDPTATTLFVEKMLPASAYEIVKYVAENLGSLQSIIQIIDTGTFNIPYDIGFRFQSTPDPSEIIDFCVIATPFTLKAGMAGALGYVESAPLQNFTMTLRSGGTLGSDTGNLIGTIIVSTAKTFTFSTPANADVLVPAGLLKLVAPSVIDVGISGLAVTIKV